MIRLWPRRAIVVKKRNLKIRFSEVNAKLPEDSHLLLQGVPQRGRYHQTPRPTPKTAINYKKDNNQFY